MRWTRGLAGGIALALCIGVSCERTALEPAEGERIVALSPSISRVLLALGARDQIVGIDRFSQPLPGLADVPSLGGVFSPDLERTLELRPSLVLAVASAEQQTFFAQLRARGVRVEEIDVYTLDEVLESFHEIGGFIGRSDEAKALVERLRTDLDEIQRSVAGRPRRTVALVLERDPLYVVGGGAFIDALIQVAGGENVFGDLRDAYPRVSLEVLADRAPQLILDTFYDPQGGPDAASDVGRYWNRFAWVQRAEDFPFAATHPAPNLSDAARLLRRRIHPELSSP